MRNIQKNHFAKGFDKQKFNQSLCKLSEGFYKLSLPKFFIEQRKKRKWERESDKGKNNNFVFQINDWFTKKGRPIKICLLK